MEDASLMPVDYGRFIQVASMPMSDEKKQELDVIAATHPYGYSEFPYMRQYGGFEKEPVLGYGGISAQYQDMREQYRNPEKPVKVVKRKFRIPVISWLIERWNTVKKI